MMVTSDNSPGASVQIAKWSRNSLGKEERFSLAEPSGGDCRADMWWQANAAFPAY